MLFRTGGNPPNDGAGGLNQGFNIDNLTTAVYNNTSGTGNEDANVITGNSGDNALSGLGGNDTLLGGDGNDTLEAGPESIQRFTPGLWHSPTASPAIGWSTAASSAPARIRSRTSRSCNTPAAVICWLAMVVSLPPRTQLPPPHMPATPSCSPRRPSVRSTSISAARMMIST